MKNWISILLVVFIMISCFIAGFFSGKSKHQEIVKVPVIRADQKTQAKLDSFETVDKVHHYFLGLYKKRLSKFAKIIIESSKQNAYQQIALPCDSNHVIDSLYNDITTYQEITQNQDSTITLQDSTIALKNRFIYFLRSTIQEGNDKLAELQYKVNQDAEKQKRTKLKIFLSGLGIGAGTILAAIIVF